MNKPVLFFIVLICLAAGVEVRGQGTENTQPVSQILAELSLETASVLEWSPDGSLLAVGTDEGIKIYSDTLELIQYLPLFVWEILSLHWSPDGRYIAGKGMDFDDGRVQRRHILIWDVATAEMVNTFEGVFEYPSHLFLWQDDKHIITAEVDSLIYRWDAFTNATVLVVPTETKYSSTGYLTFPNSIDLSPNGTHLATIRSGLWLTVWNLARGESVFELEDKDDYFPHLGVVRWSPDGHYLFVTYLILDAVTGQTLIEFQMSEAEEFLFADWHPNSRYLVIRRPEDTLIYDIQMDEIVDTIADGQPKVWLGKSQTIDWHPDGQRLASIAEDGTVRIWQVFDD